MSGTERILVLDGHTNQALACVRSLGRAGHEVLVASHRRLPLGAWSRFCGGRFRLGGQTPAAFAELREWACERGVHTVLPLTERSCLLCAGEREAWKAHGIRVGCAPLDILERAFDKALTLQAAIKCGVRVPPTHFPRSLEECRRAAEDVGLPCVVKPPRSHAWDGARFLPDRGPCYVRRAADLDDAVLSRRQGDCWPLIQGFVPGIGKGVFALRDRSRVVAWFAHERLRDVRPAGSGSSLRRSVALEARLREPAERLLSEMEWHGPAMVEFRDDGVSPPCLMEVNGRFWGSLQLGIEAGVDFPSLWVSILSGRASDTAAAYATGVVIRWLWGDVKRFIHILEGPPAGYPGPYPTRLQGLRELFGAQPAGTRMEVWSAADPLPAVGEWVEGLREILTRR